MVYLPDFFMIFWQFWYSTSLWAYVRRDYDLQAQCCHSMPGAWRPAGTFLGQGDTRHCHVTSVWGDTHGGEWLLCYLFAQGQLQEEPPTQEPWWCCTCDAVPKQDLEQQRIPAAVDIADLQV